MSTCKHRTTVWLRRLWSLGVLFTCFSCMMLSSGTTSSMSILVVEFLEYFRESKFATSWCSSVCMTLTLGTAPLWMVALQKVSHRQLIIVGIIASTIGLFASAFATSIYHLYATLGVITGLGFSVLSYISLVYASEYFTEQRYLVVGFISTGSAVGSLVIPVVLHSLVDAYTWRGTLVIMAAVMAQLGVLVCFITPITNENLTSSTEIAAKDMSRDETHPLNAETQFNFDNPNESTMEQDSHNIENTVEFILISNIASHKENLLYLLRSWKLYPFLFTVSLAVFQASIYLTFNMHYFLSVGTNHSSAMVLLMCVGVGNICARVFTGVVTQYMKKRRSVILLAADALYVISFVLISKYTHFVLFAVLSVTIGFAHGCRTVGGATAALELFGETRAREEIALVMLAFGFGALLGPPTGGMVFDMTQDYSAVFMMCMALALVCAVVTLPIVFITPRANPLRSHEQNHQQ